MQILQERQRLIDAELVQAMIESTPESWVQIVLTLTRSRPTDVPVDAARPGQLGGLFLELSTPEGLKALKLTTLTLPQAFEAMAEFWVSERDFDVLAQNRDGLACYEDVTNHGRGTRLEIGLVRLLRVTSDSGQVRWPAHRLRLRLCYKWDMDVIKYVLPAGTWCFACWDPVELDTFKRSVFDTPGSSAASPPRRIASGWVYREIAEITGYPER
jgi:hypothetical protein